MLYNVAGQEMDGEALFGAFGSLDCLKDVLPKFGQRIKVYKAIKVEMESLQGDSTTSVRSMPNSSSREVDSDLFYVLKCKMCV